jgi:uncharacterized protein (TIGR02246 family)
MPAMTHPLHDFADRYTAAWCSDDPSQVADFFALNGALTINGGVPSVGRDAITASAASFMQAFPDLVVTLRSVEDTDGRVAYHWTLAGTNTGPGGTGRAVRIDGTELWQLDDDGLIADSIGTFDAEEYARQLQGN